MQIVKFEGIERAYRKGPNVLDGVSFDVERGEVVGLLGANGAGKTTLLRIAMGMLAPQAGQARVFGLDPRLDPMSVKRRVGYVSEDQILPEFLKVRDVVRLHRGLFPDWDDELARSLGERFAIDPGAKIKALSKGQARQVALLCAVAHRPERTAVQGLRGAYLFALLDPRRLQPRVLRLAVEPAHPGGARRRHPCGGAVAALLDP